MIPKLRKPFNGEAPISFRFGEAPAWYLAQFHYPHNGIDFAMAAGRAILSTYNGVVSFADSVPDSDGCGIIISHDWGLSLYWHLSKLTAKRGEQLKQGDILGLSGATGFVTGAHLHFGVKINDLPNETMKNWCDPLPYLQPEYTPPEAPVIVPRYHRVGFGESLWKIAEKYYQDGAYWRKIYDANRDQIKDPGLIYPLQKLLIP
jgi:murein DD-endopeptidase MepM/ murein hydrolase activator NlpD